ncbi:type VI secretion protein, partial [Xanthomonas euvesicatoria]
MSADEQFHDEGESLVAAMTRPT